MVILLGSLLEDYFALMIFLMGTLVALFFINKYRKAEKYAKLCGYGLFILAYYGFGILLIVNIICYTPVENEYTILFCLCLHYTRNFHPISQLLIYYFLSNLETQTLYFHTWTAYLLDNYRVPIALLFETILPLIFLAKSMKK